MSCCNVASYAVSNWRSPWVLVECPAKKLYRFAANASRQKRKVSVAKRRQIRMLSQVSLEEVGVHLRPFGALIAAITALHVVWHLRTGGATALIANLMCFMATGWTILLPMMGNGDCGELWRAEAALAFTVVVGAFFQDAYFCGLFDLWVLALGGAMLGTAIRGFRGYYIILAGVAGWVVVRTAEEGWGVGLWSLLQTFGFIAKAREAGLDHLTETDDLAEVAGRQQFGTRWTLTTMIVRLLACMMAALAARLFADRADRERTVFMAVGALADADFEETERLAAELPVAMRDYLLKCNARIRDSHISSSTEESGSIPDWPVLNTPMAMAAPEPLSPGPWPLEKDLALSDVGPGYTGLRALVPVPRRPRSRSCPPDPLRGFVDPLSRQSFQYEKDAMSVDHVSDVSLPLPPPKPSATPPPATLPVSDSTTSMSGEVHPPSAGKTSECDACRETPATTPPPALTPQVHAAADSTVGPSTSSESGSVEHVVRSPKTDPVDSSARNLPKQVDDRGNHQTGIDAQRPAVAASQPVPQGVPYGFAQQPVYPPWMMWPAPHAMPPYPFPAPPQWQLPPGYAPPQGWHRPQDAPVKAAAATTADVPGAATSPVDGAAGDLPGTILKAPSPPPCSHNNWDSTRRKRGWQMLRCRDCKQQWRLFTKTTDGTAARVFCSAFRSPEGCEAGPSCPLPHVHRYKTCTGAGDARHSGSDEDCDADVLAM